MFSAQDHAQCYFFNKISQINKREVLYLYFFADTIYKVKKILSCYHYNATIMPKNNNNKRNDKVPYRIFVILKRKIYITESKSFIPISFRLGGAP